MVKIVDINKLRSLIHRLPGQDPPHGPDSALIVKLAEVQSRMMRLELRQYELRDAIYWELKKDWSPEELSKVRDCLNLGNPTFA